MKEISVRRSWINAKNSSEIETGLAIDIPFQRNVGNLNYRNIHSNVLKNVIPYTNPGSIYEEFLPSIKLHSPGALEKKGKKML